MNERPTPTWLAKVNLHTALKDWQDNPGKKSSTQKVETAFSMVRRPDTLIVSLDKGATRTLDRNEAFLQYSVVEAYGQDDGNSIFFGLTRGLKFRVGYLNGIGLLFIEKDGLPLGYCHPRFINGFSVSPTPENPI